MEDSITLKRSEPRRVQVLMQLAGGVISSGQAAEFRGVCGLVLHQLETGHRVGSQKPDFQRVS